MATKTQAVPHPPFAPNPLLVELAALGVGDVKVRSEPSYRSGTEWKFTKDETDLRIEETEQHTRPEMWSREGSKPTGRRSVSVKRPGEWRNNRKFFCKQGVWPYAEIAQVMKHCWDAEAATNQNQTGYEKLVATLGANGFRKLPYGVLRKSGGGPNCTLNFDHLTAEQAITILTAARAAGIVL